MCVNPRHLRWGTSADNMKDMVLRNRSNPARGERSGSAKLREAIVAQIRADDEHHSAIAKKHGVDPSLISLIKSRKRWGHVA